jgi:integrase
MPLAPATVAALQQQAAMQAAEAAQWGSAWQDSGHVFTREDGSPWHPDAVSGAFEQAQLGVPVPRIRLHDLRHTCATLALQAVVHPKVVSEMLGHANIAITLDVYSHAIPAMQAEAAEQIASLFADISGECGQSAGKTPVPEW